MHRKLERNKKTKTVSKPIVLGGQTYRYVIARNSKAGHPNEDDYIYFLTSLKNGALGRQAVSLPLADRSDLQAPKVQRF